MDYVIQNIFLKNSIPDYVIKKLIMFMKKLIMNLEKDFQIT